MSAFAVAWRKFAGLFQTSILDPLRNYTPQAPNAYQTLSLPAASYEDPKPTNATNYDNYLTAAVQPGNAA